MVCMFTKETKENTARSMSSWKHPWDKEAASKSLSDNGMYEASANIMWVNPFPVDEEAQRIAGDPPQWKSLLQAVEKFMTLDASENRSLAPTQGTETRVARLVFPISIAAHCRDVADGGNIRVLGHFPMVFGQLYVQAFYIGMFQAMEKEDLQLVASLWQMGRTVTMQVRSNLSTAHLAIWSLKESELAHHLDGVLGDSFPAFARKCLKILKENDDDATASDEGDTMTSRKATTKLEKAGVSFKGNKLNQTMANAVLAFHNHITQRSLELFAVIEGACGRDMLSMSYAKIKNIISCCKEGSKATHIAVGTLIETTLDALNCKLQQNEVKPADVTVGWLVEPKGKGMQDATTGFVVKAISRLAFLRHVESKVLDFEKKGGDRVAATVNELKTVLEMSKTYQSFLKELVAPDDQAEDLFREQYKEKNTQTKLGKIAVELVYDVLNGDRDEELVEIVKPHGEWSKQAIDWSSFDHQLWIDLARQMITMGGAVTLESKVPVTLESKAPDLETESSKTPEDAKDIEDEKQARLLEQENTRTKATEARRKLVNFYIPKAWTQKELTATYESSKAHKWSDGKATESHRLFIYSADLLEEDTSKDGKPWVQTPAWTPAGEECVKFIQSKARGAADLSVFFDGRSSEQCKLALLQHHVKNDRNRAQGTITYGPTTRLGKIMPFGSDNTETYFLSLPAPRSSFPLKKRYEGYGDAVGEYTTHDMSYSGVVPMSWASMPPVVQGDKAKILGENAGISDGSRVFDTSLSQPLLWQERKPVDFWRSFFVNLDVQMIIDCTPGSGTAARAALELQIPYCGLARNEHHANFLGKVLDKRALKLMQTEGNFMFQDKQLADCISSHYQDDMDVLLEQDNANDTEPVAEITLEDLA